MGKNRVREVTSYVYWDYKGKRDAFCCQCRSRNSQSFDSNFILVDSLSSLRWIFILYETCNFIRGTTGYLNIACDRITLKKGLYRPFVHLLLRQLNNATLLLNKELKCSGDIRDVQVFYLPGLTTSTSRLFSPECLLAVSRCHSNVLINHHHPLRASGKTFAEGEDWGGYLFWGKYIKLRGPTEDVWQVPKVEQEKVLMVCTFHILSLVGWTLTLDSHGDCTIGKTPRHWTIWWFRRMYLAFSKRK